MTIAPTVHHEDSFLPAGVYGFQAGLDVLSAMLDGNESLTHVRQIVLNSSEWWITESGDCHPEIVSAIDSVVSNMEDQPRPDSPEQFDTYMDAACQCIIDESSFLSQNKQHADAFRHAMIHQARGVVPECDQRLITLISQKLSERQADFVALCKTWSDVGIVKA